MIQLRAVQGKTGRLLAELLGAQGVVLTASNPKGIISYGVPIESKLPTLNGNAGKLNKFEELGKLEEKKVPTIPFSQYPIRMIKTSVYFGRSFKHTKGKDIVVYKDWDAIPHYHKHQYFTQFIPHIREFRVWTYRGRHLSAYEKIRRFKRGKNHPLKIWNWRNGYAFEYVPECPEALKQIGRDAIAALDLDFGAVDVIETEDHRYLVLEVNTAPGTQGPRQGLQNLATKMANWVKGGMKKRRGDVKPD